jgi:hypothetical protein
MDKLQELMSSAGTYPDIQATIIAYLKGWWSGIVLETQVNMDLNRVINQQSLFRWQLFFKGW